MNENGRDGTGSLNGQGVVFSPGVSYLQAREESRTERAWKAVCRNPTTLLIVIILAGLVMVVCAEVIKSPAIVITITGITTNVGGHPEVIVTLNNEGVDITMTPVLQVATSEDYGTANNFTRFSRYSSARRGVRPALILQERRGDVVNYHTVKGFRDSQTEVQSNTGDAVKRGATATLTFKRPQETFRLKIDCYQTSTNESLRDRLGRWNAWASSKRGAPIIFEDTSWSQMFLTAPCISFRDITNQAPLRSVGHPFEFRP